MLAAKFFFAFIASVSAGSLVASNSHETLPISQEIAAMKYDASNERTRPSSGSIRAAIAAGPSATQRAECLLPSTFTAAKTSFESSSCHEGEWCTEDPTSSIGGRCVGLEEEELVDDSEAHLPGRDLQEECTKCQGTFACQGVADKSKIGCGSCIGYAACLDVNHYVGENSCIGRAACYTTKGDVGSHSCQGYQSCLFARVSIGSCQCYGKETCSGKSNTALSSDGVCPSESPSSSSHPTASNSPSALPSYQPSQCRKCEGYAACDGVDDLSKIGCGACIGAFACYEVLHNVGENSCIGGAACRRVQGDVGSYSCQGGSSCLEATVPIGSCQCYGNFVCKETSNTAFSNDGMCPSESPSSSSQPTASNSPSASHRPSSIPSLRPSSMPSDSPSSSSQPTASNSPSASHQPSSIPSLRPSSMPSESTHPSSQPTDELSSSPSSPPSKPCSTIARTVKIESTTGEQIQLFDVKVFSVSGVDETKEVTANATQSSTFKNDESFIASNAIDSDFGSFSHTDDDNAWWQVDMGKNVEVISLEIINRWCGDTISIPDHCLCRLSGAKLSLLDDNGVDISTQTLGNTCSKPSLKVDFDYNCNSCLPNASKIKLQSSTGKALGLLEVEVYSAGVNVAADKNATASSTFRDLDRLAAGAAVDEDYTSFSVNGATDTSPWWEVDLGGSFDISDLKIFNRLNKNLPTGGLCNLSQVDILLLNADGSWIDVLLTGDTCGLLLWEHEYESSPQYCLRNNISEIDGSSGYS